MNQITWTNEKRTLRSLAPWENNPRYIKDAQAERLLESFNEFGQVLPICIGPSGEVYDGHQRRSVIGAADAYGMDFEIDVRVASRELSERERQKLTVYLHQGAAGQWDFEELANSFDFDDLVLWGFDSDFLLGNGFDEPEEAEPSDAEPQIDRAAELLEKWGVKPGDLWQIGGHRLVCGDCTDAATVEMVMGGEKADTLIFDPPWDSQVNIPVDGYQSVLAFADGYRIGDLVEIFGRPTWIFVWDCVTSWYTPNRPLRRHKNCLWYGDISMFDFDAAHYGEAPEAKTVTNTRGSYDYKPDTRGKHLSDVFVSQITAEHATHLHKHQKPLDWMRLLIGDCTNGLVYDPFMGSGTSLVACHQLGRLCFGCELEPANVAVVLEWVTDLGIHPVRDAD